MHLFLIRHGETDWNFEGRIQGWTDIPLNARGIEQATQLAERLAVEESIRSLYTSPLIRAQMTAGIIGQRIGLVPTADQRLIERSPGKVEGLTLAEIEHVFPDVYRAWRSDEEHVVLPEAEDQHMFRARVDSFLQMLRAQHTDSRVAVVTHGGTCGMMIATILGLDPTKRSPFRFDNTSVSRIDMARRRPRIELLNDTCHLLPTRANWGTPSPADVPVEQEATELETE